jgi:hypothetical protein
MYEFQAFSDITMYTMEKSQSERRKDINFRRLVNSEKQAMSYSGSVFTLLHLRIQEIKMAYSVELDKDFCMPHPSA